ncbi:MAG: hypothetical protein EP329_02180 [Deltaproteobacteria bacterium]|nr:MAG: hypothetical protein EP329_02180 [Deltaproteobacteria bacterium]
MAPRSVLLSCILLLASTPACGGSSTTGDPAGDTSAALDDTAAETGLPDAEDASAGDVEGVDGDVAAADTGPPGGRNPLGAALALELEPFDVAVGTERQVCKTLNLPSDAPLDLVRLHAVMEGRSHHFNLYKVIDAKAFEPVTEAEATVHDCAPADEQLSGDAAYLFGSATPERTFDTPEGVAFHLEPGQRLILEQHVINYTTEPMRGGVHLSLYGAGEDADIRHHADIIWFANWGFALPPDAETTSTKLCEVPYDVEIFGLMSHFHELGTAFSIETVSGDEVEEVYYDTDWAHPAYVEYWPPLSLAAGDGLQWTCTWFNTTDRIVLPNKSSTDEMCITFAAAYPKDTLSGDPIQCNVVF